MHIYPYEDRSREFTRRDESLWRMANKLIAAFHIAGYVTCFVLLTIGVNQIQTSPPWIAGADLRYQEWAAARLVDCDTEYTWGDAMISGVTSTINEGIVNLLTAEYYYLLRRCMIVNGLALGISIVNKIFFSSNLYFLKLRYFVFRKDTISMLEVAFLIAAFGTVADQERVREPLNRHLQYCINGKTYDVQQFIFTSGFNLVALWIVLGVTSAVTVIQIAFFIYHSVTDVPPPPTQPQRFFTGHATTTEPLPDAKVLEPPAEMREILRKKRPPGVRRRAAVVANGGPSAAAAEDNGNVASPDMVLPAGRSRRRRRAAGSPKRPGEASDNAAASASGASVAPAGSPGHASVTLGGFAVPQTHGLSLQGFDDPGSTAFAQSLANAGDADADAEVDAPDEFGESTV